MKQLIVLLIFVIAACTPESQILVENELPIDQNATEETKALYINLKKLSGTSVMFGHQDDLAYGYSWWAEPGRSDVKESTGSYPAIYGWDLGDLELKKTSNLDDVEFHNMKNWIKEGYDRGGVITISWHMNHPITQGNSWDKVSAVKEILPGQLNHNKLINYLDEFALFINDLKGKNGEQIPIIFRPFHEHNGDWFWWGKGVTEEADYITLWRFTIDYLKDQKKLNNLLYAYSPDRSRMNINNFTENYFYGYPGDEYVDIIGLDNYWDLGHPNNTTSDKDKKSDFIKSVTELVQIADSLGKIPAITETGLDGLHNFKWWTEILAEGLLENLHTKRIAYVHTWRNANAEKYGSKDHFFASHPNHASASNMKEFRDMEIFLFEDELPNMYK